MTYDELFDHLFYGLDIDYQEAIEACDRHFLILEEDY